MKNNRLNAPCPFVGRENCVDCDIPFTNCPYVQGPLVTGIDDRTYGQIRKHSPGRSFQEAQRMIEQQTERISLAAHFMESRLQEAEDCESFLMSELEEDEELIVALIAEVQFLIRAIMDAKVDIPTDVHPVWIGPFVEDADDYDGYVEIPYRFVPR